MDGELNKILGGSGGSLYRPEEKPVFTWGILSVSGVAFGIVFLIYAGLAFGYKSLLNNSIADIEAKTKEISAQRQQDAAANQFTSGFIDLYSQATNAKKLLAAHTSFQPVFDFLENTTRPDVYYKTIQVSKDDNLVSVTGIAKDYSAFSNQMAIFNASPLVTGTSVMGVVENEEGIPFDIRIAVVPEMFKYSVLQPSMAGSTDASQNQVGSAGSSQNQTNQ